MRCNQQFSRDIIVLFQDNGTSQSKQNSQSSSMTFIYKTLIIPSFLDSCFISSTVCEDKRAMLRLDFKICAKDKNFSSIWTYTTMMLPRVHNHHGENVYIWDLVDFDVTMSTSRGKTSKDNEDPGWSISFKTRRTQKTSSTLEDFICVVFVPDRNIMFIKSRIYLDDEYVVMTRNYFLQYTQLKILEFRDTLIHHMESVKKSIDERAQHKQEYDSRVNDRQMLTIMEKVDTSTTLDGSFVDIESSGTESKEHNTSSGSGNDAHADDADIRPIYDEEPMAEVQTNVEINVFATRQQHTEQHEFNKEGEVDQNAEQWHDTCPLPAKLTDNQITKLSYQSLESKNICLKKTVAQFQKDFLRMEAHCVNLELKYQNQALKEGQCGQFLKVKSNEAKSLIAYAQTTKTYYKHQDSRIKKSQALKTKTSVNSDIKDNSSETRLRGRLLESFQEDAKCDHVGQDTRSQGGKDDQD
ncbi:hypothetical protein Tco_1494147 [Tanacetum coccineum]